MRTRGAVMRRQARAQARGGEGRHRWLLLDDAMPGGWYLLRGVLRRRGGTYDAQLHLDMGTGLDRIRRIPVGSSGTGAVNEVLCLPAGVRRIELVLHGDPGDYESGDWSLRPLAAVERHWRMLQRVVPQLLRQPAAKRVRLGLTFPGLLRNLARSYEDASRLRAHAPPPDYAQWLQRFDALSEDDCRQIRAHIERWTQPPRFHVMVAGADPREAANRTLASLDRQLYRNFQCTRVAAGAGELAAFNAQWSTAGAGEFVVLLRPGDVLSPHALYWFAATVVADPDAVVIYGDEDVVDSAGQRRDPFFKPEWSWAHARSTPFTGNAVALHAASLARGGGLTQNDLAHGCYDAMLRCLDAAPEPRVCHAPGLLLHRPAAPPRAQGGDPWAMAAVRAHLARQRVPAEVEPTGAGRWRVRYVLPDPLPLVSIIVPARDALELTRRCIETLRARTEYPRYEVLLVDNQSRDPATLEWMREQQAAGAVRLLSHEGPFNFSAINNRAVREAQGELVCLLNNDTEVIDGAWLAEMVGQLLQPEVQVVGAKLLYPDGRVQHAGDLVGVGGVANHAHAWIGADQPGYCGRALVAQEYSAVTGACLLTRRATYLALGGLDERHLPVAFNDVDYCLRVREAGGRVVWTPHAVLVHHESVSRGKDLTLAQKRRARKEAAYMRRRWHEVLQRDPFYHPNLSMERPDFSLSHAPLAPRPWQT